MKPQQHILIADDDEEMLFAVTETLREVGYRISTVDRGDRVLEAARSDPPDLILLDVTMPGRSGLEATAQLKSDSVLQYIPVVLLTAKVALSDVLQGFEAGADDYLLKPCQPEELIARVHASLRTQLLYRRLYDSHEENALLRSQLSEVSHFGTLVGESVLMKEVFSLIEKVAPADVPVLIRGESGTGKELVAREVHARGTRASGPFVVQNCAALQEQLLESALFGHARGSFTGALKDKPGLFQIAHGGTFFLDEIGEMSLPLQAKLLRVLQDNTFTPVGETKERKVDVRIVTATHRPLEEMMAAGLFREDLFYRLNVVAIEMPPLRKRREDIARLANHFLSSIAKRRGISVPQLLPEVIAQLVAYEWPGNIRQLQNEIERLVLMAGTAPFATTAMLSDTLRGRSVSSSKPHSSTVQETVIVASPSSIPTLPRSLKEEVDELERRLIEETLQTVGGNKSEAARVLGVSRSYLIGKAQLYNLEPLQK